MPRNSRTPYRSRSRSRSSRSLRRSRSNRPRNRLTDCPAHQIRKTQKPFRCVNILSQAGAKELARRNRAILPGGRRADTGHKPCRHYQVRRRCIEPYRCVNEYGQAHLDDIKCQEDKMNQAPQGFVGFGQLSLPSLPSLPVPLPPALPPFGRSSSPFNNSYGRSSPSPEFVVPEGFSNYRSPQRRRSSQRQLYAFSG